jgi:hypothetical protein
MPQGPNFLVTFLYYFAMTTLIVLLTTSQGMGVSLNTGLPYQLGILSGAIAGLLGAYFNRSATISVAFQNQQTFKQTLEETLAQMGFNQKTQLEDYTAYNKPNASNLFSGKIFVKIEDKSATIIGRAKNLKQIKKAEGMIKS